MSAKPSASIGLMSSIVTSEGLSLHTREWPAAAGTARGTVLIVHGLGDHVGRYANVAAALNAAGWRVVGYDQLPRAIELMMALPTYDAIVADVKAAMDLLEAQKETDRGRIGMTGFCMGGFLTFLSSCRLPIKAAAPFYGGGIGRSMLPPSPSRPHPPIEEANGITGSMVVFYGDKDGFIPPEECALVKDRLAQLGKDAEVIIYPGADHGFFCEERPSYHEAAAQDSWKRLLKLFDTKLRG